MILILSLIQLFSAVESMSSSQGNQDVNETKKEAWQLPLVSLDISSVQKQFLEAEEGRRMVVHEQLTAMERSATLQCVFVPMRRILVG